MMHHVEQLGITFKRMCNVRELKAFLKAIPHVQEFRKKLQFVPFTKHLFNPSRNSTDRIIDHEYSVHRCLWHDLLSYKNDQLLIIEILLNGTFLESRLPLCYSLCQ